MGYFETLFPENMLVHYIATKNTRAQFDVGHIRKTNSVIQKH